MKASTLSVSVSSEACLLSDNLSNNLLCLRAEAATFASAYSYRFDYTDADHEALIALLRTLPASVMISGYHSDLYAGLLLAPEWRSVSYQVKTRGGPRTEYLWMNYAANAAHWADHAGVDFTDRQRIKRKAARWQRMYRELPASERMAVLAAILEPEPA